MIKRDTDIFKKEAGLKHNYIFNYDKSVYTGYKNKLIITCKHHGDFEQIARHHLNGSGCPKCAHSKKKYNSSNKEEFIIKANIKHANRFDYSLVIYINNSTKVKIICPYHGVFEQTPAMHLNSKYGCPKCAFETNTLKLTLNTEEFIRRAILVHGDRYDYSLVAYVNIHTKVKIICKVEGHGIFEQTPANHLQRQGCPICAGNKLISKEGLIKEFNIIHNNFYDYSKTEYVNSKTEICITCPDHGDFWQLPSLHKKGAGCPICAIDKINRLNLKKGWNRIRPKIVERHPDLINLDKVEYKGYRTVTEFECKHHGFFKGIPSNIVRGMGCPECCRQGTSIAEKELLTYIKSIYKGSVLENNREIIKPKELDIYLPELQIAFEYNGLYWHSEINLHKDYHKEKTESCMINGVTLYHIYEDDWHNRKDITKEKILKILSTDKESGSDTMKNISKAVAKKYFNLNSLKSYKDSDINIGLFKNDDIIAVLCAKKEYLKYTITQVELGRYVNHIDLDKCINFMLKEGGIENIEITCNRCWNENIPYEKIGFIKIEDIKPDYKNIKISSRLFERYDKNIKIEGNVLKIYDSGHCKLIKYKINNEQHSNFK